MKRPIFLVHTYFFSIYNRAKKGTNSITHLKILPETIYGKL